MEAQTLEPGTEIDRRYTIRRFIASGGVAYVYAATHKITGKDVALKLPRSDRERDRTVHERLVREGQALAHARHPGVVELVDAGEHAGFPYLALELLEGRTLGGLLAARGKLGWEEVTYVGLKLADILAHCHQNGVIHRDIKPDNLFALPSGAWNVKLFDFGIARLLGAEAEGPVDQAHAGRLDPRDSRIHGARVAPDGERSGSPRRRLRARHHAVRASHRRRPVRGPLRRGARSGVDEAHAVDSDAAARRAAGPRCGRRALSREGAQARALKRWPKWRGSFASCSEGSTACRSRRPLRADTPRTEGEKRTVADTPAAFQSVGRAAPAAGKRRFPRAPYTTPLEVKLASGESISGPDRGDLGGRPAVHRRARSESWAIAESSASPSRSRGKVLKLSGVSRWTKEARGARHATGFEFENAPDDTRATIKKYVELMGGV